MQNYERKISILMSLQQKYADGALIPLYTPDPLVLNKRKQGLQFFDISKDSFHRKGDNALWLLNMKIRWADNLEIWIITKLKELLEYNTFDDDVIFAITTFI